MNTYHLPAVKGNRWLVPRVCGFASGDSLSLLYLVLRTDWKYLFIAIFNSIGQRIERFWVDTLKGRYINVLLLLFSLPPPSSLQIIFVLPLCLSLPGLSTRNWSFYTALTLICLLSPYGNRTWASHGLSFGQPLWFDTVLMNKVPCAWLLSGTLEV